MAPRSAGEPRHEDGRRRAVSDALVAGLVRLGCRRAFGILGGAAVPMFSALVEGGLDPVHTRHESGAAFMALEHELAGGGPGVVFTTTGPGLINALTGMQAARHEGGRIVLLSAATGAERRGRGAFQETDLHTYGNCGLFGASGWFDYAVAMSSGAELPVVLARLAEGLSRPQGFVAHVALPLSVQTELHEGDNHAPGLTVISPAAPEELIEELALRLQSGSAVVWVGHGARAAAPRVQALVDALDARVMSSPRGKGIFPESDPRHLGVTGFGGHQAVFDRLERLRPRTTLVLGTRLGEFTSFWDPRLVADTTLVHVDTDPSAFGAAYPSAHTIGVRMEVGSFLDSLLRHLPRRSPRRVPRAAGRAAAAPPRAPGRVRPSELMRAIQRVIVDGSDAPVMSEAGNAFLWTTHALRFDEPGRYRTSMTFGSMGHFAAGVVGAAMARGGPAVTVVGDGSMLMSNEVSTAVSLDIPAVWIVLNDGRYGLVCDGMQGLGYDPYGLDFHPADFVLMARALGAEGLRVTDEADLDRVLSAAIGSGRPTLVDVAVDESELAPFGTRNDSLARQASGTPEDVR